jgi:hypothetical protein
MRPAPDSRSTTWGSRAASTTAAWPGSSAGRSPSSGACSRSHSYYTFAAAGWNYDGDRHLGLLGVGAEGSFTTNGNDEGGYGRTLDATADWAPDRRPASAAAFRFDDPNFNVRSLRGNAVLRWEYRPGSTLFFVWQQERSGSEPIGDFAFRRDAAEILAAPATNVLLIKATYWLGADSARAPGGAQPGSPPARRRGGLRPQPGAPLGAHPAGAASARPAVSQARLDSGRRAAGRA